MRFRTTRQFGAVIAIGGWLALATIATPAFGNSLDDFFNPDETDSGPIDGRLYSGHVTGSVQGGKIQTLTLTGQGRSITFTPNTDENFQSFVDNNAETIIAILFPSGLEGGAEGVPGGSARALEAFDRLIDIGPIAPAARPRMGPDGTMSIAARNETSALFEYERYRVEREDGNMYKLTPGYEFRFDRLQLGFAVPLRYSELEDHLDTEAFTGGLDLHAKYDIYLYPEWRLVPMVGAGSNVFLVDSHRTAGAGYIRYGGYVGLSTIYEGSQFVVGGGVMYSVSDVALPDGLIPHELEPIADALSSRPADQQITFGAKGAYQLPWRLLVAAGARHVETVGSSDIDLSKQTLDQFTGSLMYVPTDNVALELGYKYLTAVSNLYSSAIFLQGALYF